VHNNLSRDAYFAIADEARKQNMPLVGHVPRAITVAEASDAGQRSIEHLGGMPFRLLAAVSDTTDREPDTSRPPSLLSMADHLAYNKEKADPLFARFATNSTWQTPTLVTYYGIAHADEARSSALPYMKYLPASVKDSWTEGAQSERMRNPESRPAIKRFLDETARLIRPVKAAGVRFLAGTDAPVSYAVPGYSLHDELVLLVKHGLTAMEALQSATVNPARFLGREKELGTIQKGKHADLVLLDANPLQNIHNTRRIRAVVANGRLLDRTTLDKMLADLEAAAAAAK